MFKLLVLSIAFKLVSSGGDSFDPTSSINQFIVRKLDLDSATSVDDEAFSEKLFDEVTSADPTSNTFWVSQFDGLIESAATETPKRKIKKRKKFVMKPPA